MVLDRDCGEIMQIITVIICAVVLLGMAKKTENKWRQLSLLSAGKAAVNIQRAGEDVMPSEMYFGNAVCMGSLFDLNRMLIRENENGWIRDDADILIIVDERPSKSALMITSKPLQRFFTDIAAQAIDAGATSSEKKVLGDGFKGIIDVVELDGSTLGVFELGKGEEKYSPYFVIEKGDSDVQDA